MSVCCFNYFNLKRDNISSLNLGQAHFSRIAFYSINQSLSTAVTPTEWLSQYSFWYTLLIFFLKGFSYFNSNSRAVYSGRAAAGHIFVAFSPWIEALFFPIKVNCIEYTSLEKTSGNWTSGIDFVNFNCSRRRRCGCWRARSCTRCSWWWRRRGGTWSSSDRKWQSANRWGEISIKKTYILLFF